MQFELLKSKRKILFSPHFDDLALSLGGLLFYFKKEKIIVEDQVVFGVCQYQYGSKQNSNFSSEHIKHVSQLRYEEEKTLANYLGNVEISLLNFPESTLRGHQVSYGENVEQIKFNPEDKVILSQLEEHFKILSEQDCQLFIPLAIGNHYDHLLVREAALNVIRITRPKAEFYFYEDLPYVVKASRSELQQLQGIISEYNLKTFTIPIDLNKKIALLEIYQSQQDPDYYRALVKRSRDLQNKYKSLLPLEQLYCYE